MRRGLHRPQNAHGGQPESELDRALWLNRGGRIRRYGVAGADLVKTFRAAFGSDLMRQAGEDHRQFRLRPNLRAEWEPKIMSGQVELCEVLRAIGAE